MKILFFNYEYPPLGGGAANANKYLLQAYRENSRISVDLITSSPNDEEQVISLNERIRVHTLAIGKTEETLHHQSQLELLRYSYKACHYAKKLLAKEKYDVIHAFFAVPCGVVAWRLGKRYHLPYIVSLRGSDVPGYSERFSVVYFFLTPLITKVWREAQKVVANSTGLQALAHQAAPLQEIGVIPNGVDTKKFVPGVPPVEEWIITAGATRLTERKGLHLIIEALPALVAAYPQVVFEVMGEGAAESALREQANILGVAKHIRFLGRIDSSKTPSFYQRARVFVLPSANEGMSNALLEALASGLPAVVTDTGGSQELVEEGVNGFIIARTPKAIETALKKLLADEDLRKQLGAASRVRAEAQSWQRVAKEYEELYNQAIR